MLNFQRIAPLFQADEQVALADQGGQVIRFDLQNFLQSLQRVFIALGTFQIFPQLQQDFDIPVVDAMGMLVEPDGFGEVVF